MKNSKLTLCSSVFTFAVTFSEFTKADDTEIYVAPSTGVKSNVLLLIDTSGSMGNGVAISDPSSYGDDYTPIPSGYDASYHTPHYIPDEPGLRLTRMELVKDVATNLILNTDKINLSLMRYNYFAGGRVSLASEDIDVVDSNGVSTTRKSFIEALYDYTASGFTPLEESYHEAALYFMGETPKYHGNEFILDWNNNQYSQLETSVSSALNSDGTFKSPIVNECQLDNNIILFTDGAPTEDQASNSDIQTLISSFSSIPADLSDECDGNGQCMDELAYYLRNTDLIDDSKLDKVQRVTTYPVGFGFTSGSDAESLLNSVAKHGQGDDSATAYTPSSAAGLSSALQEIFNEIQDKASTFTAPVVSINATNRLEHREEVYFALFKPQSHAQWEGNIKRYKIDSSGAITDVNEDDAVDQNTGFFKDSAHSWWSNDVDGKTVSKGGVAEQLTASRTVYTNTGSTGFLSDSSNALAYSNTAVTKEMLRIVDESDQYRIDLLNWAGGKSDSGSATHYLADPLHSQPVVIGKTLYYGDNMGYLHGINTDDGSERFAFIPQDLLPNLHKYYEQEVGVGKVYGLDGDITPITVNGRTYLIVGMRRGGHNYYAVDVTNDTSTPVLKWIINGKTGDFTELGQTWSKPTEGFVKVGGVDKQVLIFSGGYDRNQDPVYTNIDADELAARERAVEDAQTDVDDQISAIAAATATADANISAKQTALDQAEQAIVDRKAELDLADQLVADKQDELDQARTDSQDELDALNQQLIQANNDLQDAADDVTAKQNELDNVNDWLEEHAKWANWETHWRASRRAKYAEWKVEDDKRVVLEGELVPLLAEQQVKQDIVDDLQAQYDAGGPTVVQKEAELNNAQSAQGVANQAYTDAQTAKTTAETNLSTAITNKANQLNAMNDELATYRSNLGDLQDELDEITGGVKTLTDNIGRAVFVVDAATGERLWSAGPDGSHSLEMANMEFGFPADVTLGDLDNNGYTDFVVAVDVRGHVWRFDFVDDDLSKARGGMIADLGNGNATNPTRFYNRPDVALFNPRGGAAFRTNFAPPTRSLPSDASDEDKNAPPSGTAFLTISMGSGYRAHPLTTDDADNFFSIWDPYVTDLPPTDYQYVAVREEDSSGELELRSTHLLTKSDLYDASSNLLQTGTADTGSVKGTKSIAQDNLRKKNGWFFAMQSDEKVLSDSLTFNGTLFFSAFSPTGSSETCGTDLGSNRAYAVNVIDATAVFGLDSDGEFVAHNSAGTVDRMMTLKQQGIASDPGIIFTPKDTDIPTGDDDGSTETVTATSPILCFGPYCTDVVNNTPLITTYWLEND